MKEKSTDFVTPTKASGEAQEEEISPTILEAGKTLSKVASQGVSKEKSTDKGKRYMRRARSMAKKIDTGLDAEEEINTGREKKDWDAIRSKLKANTELLKDVLGQDLPEQDFAKRMAEMVNQRQKHFAEEKAKAKRNKPMTQSQLRIYMSNYLKNQGTWKLSQLKKLKFKEIKEEFDKFDDKDVPAIGDKVAKVKEEETVKRTGKKRSKRLEKYGTNRPEDVYDRVLWSYLKTMFDPPLIEDAIWSLPLQQKMFPLSKDACPSDAENEASRLEKMNEVCYKLLKMIEKKAGIRKFVIVFIDDILAYSKSKEEHEVHVKLVLDVLKEVRSLGDALCKKERVKSRRVRGIISADQSEAFKQENVLLVGSVMDEAHASRYLVHLGADKMYYNLGDMYWYPRVEKDITTYVSNYNSKEWNSGDDQLRSRWMTNLVVLADTVESVRDAIGFEYCLASLSGWTNIRCAPFEAVYGRKCRSPVLWVEIGEGSLIGPELVLETTNKVVLIKEKLKAARDRQKSYADKRRKPLEFEVGDHVLLKVSPWKGVMRFGKKGKLAPRYVGPFEILERIGLVAYRLRLPKELNGVHDTFHVSNLKKYLADANLHVPLDEIKVDKTLCFVEEPVEIMD
ncbi:putative reverse transcriptase domain-containing protein [Tanacetum coccineum]